MKQDSNRFLSPKACIKVGARGKTQRIAGWILTIFFLFAVVSSLTAGPEEQDLRDGLGIYVVGLLLSGFLLFCGFRNAARLTAAERYAALFALDQDGFVTVEELAASSGKPSAKAMSGLKKLFNMGLFQNCSLQNGGDHPGVLLPDVQLDRSAVGFVHVKCPNCGGTTRIRFGVVGKCEWCGSPIRGKESD